MAQHILRLPEVMAVTGLSRSSIYLRIKDEEFPKQVSLGGRAVGWVEQEIEDWLESKLAARSEVQSCRDE